MKRKNYSDIIKTGDRLYCREDFITDGSWKVYKCGGKWFNVRVASSHYYMTLDGDKIGFNDNGIMAHFLTEDEFYMLEENKKILDIIRDVLKNI